MSWSPGWWQRCKNRPGHWGLREERGARGASVPASTGGSPRPKTPAEVICALGSSPPQSPGWKAVAVIWFLVQVCRQESPPGKKMISQSKLEEKLQNTCENIRRRLSCACAQTSFQLLLNYSIRLTWFHYIVQSRRVNYVTETCRGAINPLTLALMGKHAAASPTRAAAARKQKPGGLFSRRSYDAYQ